MMHQQRVQCRFDRENPSSRRPSPGPQYRVERWQWVIFCLVVLSAAVNCNLDDASLLSPQPASTPSQLSAFYSPKIGDEKVCRISTKGKVDVDYGLLSHAFNPTAPTATSQGLTRHQADVTTNLLTRVLGNEDGNYVVAMRLRDFSATIDGDKEERDQLFETPFLVHVSTTGAFVKYEFPGMFPKNALSRIRGLVELLQVVGPAEDGASAWQADERTHAGNRLVSYNVSARSAEKIRVERRLLSSNESSAFFDLKNRPQLSNRIQHSKGEVVWAADGSGLLSMKLSEAMDSTLDSRALDNKAQVLRIACEAASASDLPATTDDARAGLRTDKFTKVAFYEVPEDMAEKLSKVRLDKLMSIYKESFKNERAEALSNAKYWLRLNPKQSAKFVEALTEIEMSTDEDRQLAAHGLSALAAAGHTEAQSALTEVIDGVRFDPNLRDPAVRSTLNLPRPDASVVEAVWRYRQNLPAPTRPFERAVQSMVTAIYGALGDIDYGRPEVSRQVVENLNGMLQQAATLQDRVDVLSALGNIGDLAMTLPIAEPYFQSEDWQLRGNAFGIFQTAAGDDAFNTFSAYFDEEREGYARRIAANVAVNMPYSKARNKWMQEQLLQEEDSSVAAKYAEVLGDSLRIEPENEAVLRKMLDQTDERSIRKTIYRYISPMPSGGAK